MGRDVDGASEPPPQPPLSCPLLPAPVLSRRLCWRPNPGGVRSPLPSGAPGRLPQTAPTPPPAPLSFAAARLVGCRYPPKLNRTQRIRARRCGATPRPQPLAHDGSARPDPTHSGGSWAHPTLTLPVPLSPVPFARAAKTHTHTQLSPGQCRPPWLPPPHSRTCQCRYLPSVRLRVCVVLSVSTTCTSDCTHCG